MKNTGTNTTYVDPILYEEGFFENERDYENEMKETEKILKNDANGPVRSSKEHDFTGITALKMSKTLKKVLNRVTNMFDLGM
ncbi:MAG: hypothetical protein AAF944_18250 [Bacteroidota bacterium]